MGSLYVKKEETVKNTLGRNISLLIIEREPDFRQQLITAAHRSGMKTYTASNIAQAREIVRRESLAASRKGKLDFANLIIFEYSRAAWIPFLAYLLDYFDAYTCSPNSVKLSLLMGSVSALVSLLLILVRPEAVILGSARLTITLFGIGIASTNLLVSELGQKLLLVLAAKKEGSEVKT